MPTIHGCERPFGPRVTAALAATCLLLAALGADAGEPGQHGDQAASGRGVVAAALPRAGAAAAGTSETSAGGGFNEAAATLPPGEMEAFLRTARIASTKVVRQGVTNTRRVTLSDGRFTHDAQIQTVDISLTVFKPPSGPPETNFKDSYRYNVAAYRVARLLGLDNVPMSIERQVDGRSAAVTWWIDDVAMVEGERVKRGLTGPDRERTAMQVHVMRVFDELIANRDRNRGNLLWTTDWTMWMIDHTRSFRLGTGLQNPALLERIERSLLARMRRLTAGMVADAAGRSLTAFEIRALLARRDALVEHFEERAAERGEGAVLYTQRR